MSDFFLPLQFAARLNEEARRLRVHPEDHLTALLESRIPPLRPRDLTQRFDYSSASVCLAEELTARIRQKAERKGISPEDLIVRTLDRVLVPEENLTPGALEEGLNRLESLLGRIPAIRVISTSKPKAPNWWIKFSLDLQSPVAWEVVQHLASALNGLSVSERLPTTFKPDSPPPHLNGGPGKCLCWVIQAEIPLLNAGVIADILEESLPTPVEDMDAWSSSAVDEEHDFIIDEAPVDIEEWMASRKQPALDNCERSGKVHHWFNVDGFHSACYDCRVVRPGRHW